MTKDMTTGSPVRRILAFCVPLLIGNLFQQLYNLADSILVGRILGVNAFAAVGSTGALNFLIMGFALGICSGFAIPIAQSFGAGDEDEVRRSAGQLIWLGLLFSALITLVAAEWTDDILRLTQTPEEIYDEAYRYIRVVFLGASAMILYNLSSGVLRALGDSRTPLYFLMGAVSVNVVLDVLFMKVIGMGVEGAAYATVLSQALSGAACLLYMRRRVPMLRLSRDDILPDSRRMRIIAAIGVPMGLQFSITAIGSIMVQSAVNGLGTAAVAAVKEYPLPLLIVDMGTATTISAIDASGSFLGGSISPGVKISAEALSGRTAQLPGISLEAPKHAIGRNTIDCMQSGSMLGAAAMLDGMIARMEKELGEKATVVATGGIARYVIPMCEREIRYDNDLLLKGLVILYENNKKC